MYSVSKAAAEKAAWRLSEEDGVDVVVLNPGVVVGPILPPLINTSMTLILDILQGASLSFHDHFFLFHAYGLMVSIPLWV